MLAERLKEVRENAGATKRDAAKAFIDFAVSADAAELIRLAGAVPLVDAE